MVSVLIIGARGSLGAKVMDAVIAKGKYDVKVMIRHGSNASKLEAMDGVSVVRGDMMDKASLEQAFQGIDVVINTANGYSTGHPEVDVEGAQNVADAFATCKGTRYIYCSVQTADLAKSVEHFHHKYLHEEYCKKIGIPFVALRPGAFLDQKDDYLGDNLKRDAYWAVCPWSKTVKMGMIYCPDLALDFADAIELPDSANGKCLSVGWTRNVSYEEVCKIVSDKVGQPISVYSVPYFVRSGFIYSIGMCAAKITTDMMYMFNFFDTGDYLSDPDEYKEYFKREITPEDAIGRYVDSLQLKKSESESK